MQRVSLPMMCRLLIDVPPFVLALCHDQDVCNQDHIDQVIARIDLENPTGLWALVSPS